MALAHSILDRDGQYAREELGERIKSRPDDRLWQYRRKQQIGQAEPQLVRSPYCHGFMLR